MATDIGPTRKFTADEYERVYRSWLEPAFGSSRQAAQSVGAW